MFKKIFKSLEKTQITKVESRTNTEIVQLGNVCINTLGRPGGRGEGKRPNVYSLGM